MQDIHRSINIKHRLLLVYAIHLSKIFHEDLWLKRFMIGRKEKNKRL